VLVGDGVWVDVMVFVGGDKGVWDGVVLDAGEEVSDGLDV